MTASHNFEIAPEAPLDPVITAYDERHYLTYARLLDAEAEGIDWRSGVRTILCRPDEDDETAPAGIPICGEPTGSQLKATARFLRGAVFRAASESVSGGLSGLKRAADLWPTQA
jgi:hypothetical protein